MTVGALVVLVIVIAVLARKGNSGSASPGNDNPSVPNQAATPTPTVADDHELHLVPNYLGRGAVSDGRTYSVAMIFLNRDKIPPATTLFAQGTILGDFDAGVIVLADEQDREDKLLCSMGPDESEDVSFYYHRGETVQVNGSFGVSSLGIPILRDCHVADATDEVVRPLSLPDTPATPFEQPDNEPKESVGSPTAQISIGQTPEQVIAILGPPVSVTTGQKHIFTYAHLSILFADGKVSEIRPF